MSDGLEEAGSGLSQISVGFEIATVFFAGGKKGFEIVVVKIRIGFFVEFPFALKVGF